MNKLMTGAAMAIAASCVGVTGSALAADDEPILIGMIAGTTGAYGTTGVATVRGAEIAVEHVNANGGALGRKFKLDWHNDNASATLSGQLFAKLVSDGAVVIAGSPDTGPVTAQLAERHKIPNIGVVDGGGLTVNPDGPEGPPNAWVFEFGLNTFAWGEKLGEYALKTCPDGLAVLHDPTTYGQGGLYGFELAYKKAGKEITLDRTITENWSTGATKGLMPEVNALKEAGIKCVDVWLTPQNQAAFVQDLNSAGYDAVVMGNDETNADDTYANLAGDLADGTVSATLTADLHPSAELTAFRKEYREKYDAESTLFAETSYDSIMMLAEVIKSAKSTEAKALQAEFNKTQGYKGITGTLGFSPDNHMTINAEQLTLVQYDASKKEWVELKAD